MTQMPGTLKQFYQDAKMYMMPEFHGIAKAYCIIVIINTYEYTLRLSILQLMLRIVKQNNSSSLHEITIEHVLYDMIVYDTVGASYCTEYSLSK